MVEYYTRDVVGRHLYEEANGQLEKHLVVRLGLEHFISSFNFDILTYLISFCGFFSLVNLFAFLII